MIPVKRGSTATAHRPNNNLNFNEHNSSPELGHGLKLGVYGTITVKIHRIRSTRVV